MTERSRTFRFQALAWNLGIFLFSREINLNVVPVHLNSWRETAAVFWLPLAKKGEGS